MSEPSSQAAPARDVAPFDTKLDAPDELYTHRDAAPTDNPPDTSDGDGSGAGPDAARSPTPPAAQRVGAAPGPAAPRPSAPPPVESAPELVPPQMPMDADLPPQHCGEAPGAVGAARCYPPRRSAAAGNAALEESFTRSVRSLEPISDLEAAAFAARFAVDFQSYAEDSPTRRAEVLRPLLADPQACTWGWSGEGRQRADCPLPGRTYRSSAAVVFVEVVVRVTTYARVCPAPAPTAVPPPRTAVPPGLLGPSSAPPETDPRWVASEVSWIRMSVPITRAPDDGRLVVDPHLVPDPST